MPKPPLGVGQSFVKNGGVDEIRTRVCNSATIRSLEGILDYYPILF